jgi:hypothetical protein
MAVHRRISYLIPAAAVITNVLQGTVAEFVGKAQNVRVFGTADAAGDTVSMTMTVGGDSRVLIEAGTALPVAAAVGAGPKIDEDYIGEWQVPQGAHLILAVNGTAAHTGRIAVDIQP